MPVEEAIKFFADRTTPYIDESEVDLKGLYAVEYYLNRASDNVKVEYDQPVNSRMDENGIRNFLKNYDFGKEAEVWFANGSV